jgi:undecaprenyl-diphosphatase
VRAVPALRRQVQAGEAIAVVGGATILAGSWFVVAVEREVPCWEARIFELVNDLPGFLWPIVWTPMQIGNFVGSLVVVGVTTAATHNVRLGVAALAATQVAFWTSKGIKRIAQRGRPAELLQDVELREHATGLGYISGHAAVAFALSAVLAPSVRRRWQPVVHAVAANVGISRIYAGVHLPLDVVGGTGLGLLCGTFSRWSLGLGGEGVPPRPGVRP